MTAADKLEKIYTTRINIREAIRAHQVPIRNDTPFADYPDFIAKIETGGISGGGDFSFHIEEVGETSFVLIQDGTVFPSEEDYYFNMKVNNLSISDAKMFHPTRVFIEHPSLSTDTFSIRLINYVDRRKNHFFGYQFMFLRPFDRVAEMQSLLRLESNTFFEKSKPCRVDTEWMDNLEIQIINLDTIIDLESMVDINANVYLSPTCLIDATIEETFNMEVL